MGRCTLSPYQAKPWTQGDANYQRYLPMSDLPAPIATLPFPFNWGPNGPLILLGLLVAIGAGAPLVLGWAIGVALGL
jgi:hypothetical protein